MVTNSVSSYGVTPFVWGNGLIRQIEETKLAAFSGVRVKIFTIMFFKT